MSPTLQDTMLTQHVISSWDPIEFTEENVLRFKKEPEFIY